MNDPLLEKALEHSAKSGGKFPWWVDKLAEAVLELRERLHHEHLLLSKSIDLEIELRQRAEAAEARVKELEDLMRSYDSLLD